MRITGNHQSSADSGRSPPLHLLFFCVVGIFFGLIVVLEKSPSSTLKSGISNSVEDLYRNYRRMKEEVAVDMLEVRSLWLGTSEMKELDFCRKEREHCVPCYNVSASRLAGFSGGEEFDRHCQLFGMGARCLVSAPKEYKIPMKWPVGRDIIWSSNVKMTKDQFLSYGSMTKRLMLLEENQIAFHSDNRMQIDGVGDYSRQIAEMIDLGSDAEFLQAGVLSLFLVIGGIGYRS